MADEVNNIDSSHNHLPRRDWQVLGELRLRVGSNLNSTFNEWLTKIVDPFNLPDDFVGRVVKSMEDAAARVLNPDAREGEVEFLEIVVLAPTELSSKEKTWGFFRVERTSTDTENENANGHRTEYYMYLDRNSGAYRQTP